MSAVTKLSIRCVFADETTATVVIDNINPVNGVNSSIKSIIRNFNEANGGDLASKMKSKNGYNWIGIDRAITTTTDRQYIF